MGSLHKVVVLGGGSFGTALSNMIAENGHDVILWMRSSERASECSLSSKNPKYLPGFSLNSKIIFSSDLRSSIHEADVIFFSVPSKAYREVALEVKQFIKDDARVISTAKGIESKTFKLMSKVLEEELPQARIGVISGPNLAMEIAAKEITATVVACKDPDVCIDIQELLSSRYFRVYANSDKFGVEIAGALKNIYAIAAGISSSMNMGQNTISVLITRSLAEMSRFSACLGANPMTFLGLSGVGDLFVTCTSPLSRNFQIGLALGQGLSVDEAVIKVGHVAEGINTVRIIKSESERLQVYMPIASALYETMFNGQPVEDGLRTMMLAEQNDDVEFFGR
jgi:glycerol-3-phosphate dehydrogenase (NAD(P)+)|tara:strand:- start:3620 stop:4636 length:1017 start_codon:yes stop_codon:yes gene_type:complete